MTTKSACTACKQRLHHSTPRPFETLIILLHSALIPTITSIVNFLDPFYIHEIIDSIGRTSNEAHQNKHNCMKRNEGTT